MARNEPLMVTNPTQAKTVALLWGTLVLLVESPGWLIGLFGGAAVFALRDAAPKMLAFAALSISLTTWSTVMSQGLFYGGATGEVWWRFPWPTAWGGAQPFYREGAWHGLVQSLRFSTTSLLALGWALSMQRHAGLRSPWFQRGLGLLVAFGLRHLPALARDLHLGWRTARLVGEYPLHAAPSKGALFLPLLGLVLRRAHRFAEGLFGRDVFSVQFPATRSPKPTLPSQMALALLGALVVFLLVLQVGLWLARRGVSVPERLIQMAVRWL